VAAAYRVKTMKKEKFIRQLEEVAEVLKPLTHDKSQNALVWDGKEYVKTGEERKLEPYALAWWCMLTNLAVFIEAQESPLSAKQIDFLHSLLFGGTGSLNDLFFDSQSTGEIANSINKELDKKRKILFACLIALTP